MDARTESYLIEGWYSPLVARVAGMLEDNEYIEVDDVEPIDVHIEKLEALSDKRLELLKRWEKDSTYCWVCGQPREDGVLVHEDDCELAEAIAEE